MSGQPCGCDPEADWICKMHRDYLSGISPVINEILGQQKENLDRSDRLNRLRARLAAEAQPSPAEQFRAEAVAAADAVQTRDDLLNRIAILEAEVAQLQRRNGQRQHDYLYLLEMERHDKEQFRDRIAAITATFYHADLTISSVQPILALACELNPELVERAR